MDGITKIIVGLIASCISVLLVGFIRYTGKDKTQLDVYDINLYIVSVIGFVLAIFFLFKGILEVAR